jgi:hypothetical protein
MSRQHLLVAVSQLARWPKRKNASDQETVKTAPLNSGTTDHLVETFVFTHNSFDES